MLEYGEINPAWFKEYNEKKLRKTFKIKPW